MISSRVVSPILGFAAIAGLAACAGSGTEALSRPGKFNLYNCALLDDAGDRLVKREQELDRLMQKAAQGPGGEVASAIAYRSEYNLTRGDLREIERVGAEKKCVFKHRSVSDQVVR